MVCSKCFTFHQKLHSSQLNVLLGISGSAIFSLLWRSSQHIFITSLLSLHFRAHSTVNNYTGWYVLLNRFNFLMPLQEWSLLKQWWWKIYAPVDSKSNQVLSWVYPHCACWLFAKTAYGAWLKRLLAWVRCCEWGLFLVDYSNSSTLRSTVVRVEVTCTKTIIIYIQIL